MNKLFLKRVFENKIYWLAVFSALVLLLCSVIYTEPMTGKRYTFFHLFYDKKMHDAAASGIISMKSILMGYGVENYLWMFCSIIVGIPCVLLQKTERFVLFRTSRKKYFLCKYLSNIILGGSIIFLAHLIFSFIGTMLTSEVIWDRYMVQKLFSVFIQGMVYALPGICLAEVVRNKYLILCIPFVWNYFLCMFGRSIVPQNLWAYISPENYAVLFYLEPSKIVCSVVLFIIEILICGCFIRFTIERRCDCGQK